MEDYDPACPTEDDVLPEIDLSQVPLPPPLPSQKTNEVVPAAPKSSSALPPSDADIQEEEEKKGRKKKKKKKRKGQGRTRSVAELMDDGEDDEEYNDVEENRQSRQRDPSPEEKVLSTELNMEEKGMDQKTSVGRGHQQQEAQKVQSPPELKFKLKTDPTSGKAKVSFHIKKTLRSNALKNTDSDEEEEEVEAQKKNEEEDEENVIMEKSTSAEVIPVRFKVAKKYEIFRPDMLPDKQLVINVPPVFQPPQSSVADPDPALNAASAAAAAITAAITLSEVPGMVPPVINPDALEVMGDVSGEMSKETLSAEVEETVDTDHSHQPTQDNEKEQEKVKKGMKEDGIKERRSSQRLRDRENDEKERSKGEDDNDRNEREKDRSRNRSHEKDDYKQSGRSSRYRDDKNDADRRKSTSRRRYESPTRTQSYGRTRSSRRSRSSSRERRRRRSRSKSPKTETVREDKGRSRKRRDDPESRQSEEKSKEEKESPSDRPVPSTRAEEEKAKDRHRKEEESINTRDIDSGVRNKMKDTENRDASSEKEEDQSREHQEEGVQNDLGISRDLHADRANMTEGESGSREEIASHQKRDMREKESAKKETKTKTRKDRVTNSSSNSGQEDDAEEKKSHVSKEDDSKKKKKTELDVKRRQQADDEDEKRNKEDSQEVHDEKQQSVSKEKLSEREWTDSTDISGYEYSCKKGSHSDERHKSRFSREERPDVESVSPKNTKPVLEDEANNDGTMSSARSRKSKKDRVKIEEDLRTKENTSKSRQKQRGKRHRSTSSDTSGDNHESPVREHSRKDRQSRSRREKSPDKESFQGGEILVDISAIPGKSKWEMEDEEDDNKMVEIEDIDEIRDVPSRRTLSTRSSYRERGISIESCNQHLHMQRQSDNARGRRATRWSSRGDDTTGREEEEMKMGSKEKSKDKVEKKAKKKKHKQEEKFNKKTDTKETLKMEVDPDVSDRSSSGHNQEGHGRMADTHKRLTKDEEVTGLEKRSSASKAVEEKDQPEQEDTEEILDEKDDSIEQDGDKKRSPSSALPPEDEIMVPEPDQKCHENPEINSESVRLSNEKKDGSQDQRETEQAKSPLRKLQLEEDTKHTDSVGTSRESEDSKHDVKRSEQGKSKEDEQTFRNRRSASKSSQQSQERQDRSRSNEKRRERSRVAEKHIDHSSSDERNPERRRNSSRSPERRRLSSKSPERRRIFSRSPERRRNSSRSPERRRRVRSRSHSQDRNWRGYRRRSRSNDRRSRYTRASRSSYRDYYKGRNRSRSRSWERRGRERKDRSRSRERHHRSQGSPEHERYRGGRKQRQQQGRSISLSTDSEGSSDDGSVRKGRIIISRRSQSPGKKAASASKRKNNQRSESPPKDSKKDMVDSSSSVDLLSIPIPGEIPLPKENTKREVKEKESMDRIEVMSVDNLNEEAMEISDEDNEERERPEVRDIPSETKQSKESTSKVKSLLPKSSKETEDRHDKRRDEKPEKESKGKSRQIKFSIAGSRSKVNTSIKSDLLDDDDESTIEMENKRKKALLCDLSQELDQLPKLETKTNNELVPSSAMYDQEMANRPTHVDDRDKDVELKLSHVVSDLPQRNEEGKLDDTGLEGNIESEESQGYVSMPMEGKDKAGVVKKATDEDKDKTDDVKSKTSPSPPKRLKFKYVPLWEMEGEERPTPQLSTSESKNSTTPPVLGLLDYGSNSSGGEEEEEETEPASVEGAHTPKTHSSQLEMSEKITLQDGENKPSDDSISQLVVEKINVGDNAISVSASGEDQTHPPLPQVPLSSSIGSKVYSPSHPMTEEMDGPPLLSPQFEEDENYERERSARLPSESQTSKSAKVEKDNLTAPLPNTVPAHATALHSIPSEPVPQSIPPPPDDTLRGVTTNQAVIVPSMLHLQQAQVAMVPPPLPVPPPATAEPQPGENHAATLLGIRSVSDSPSTKAMTIADNDMKLLISEKSSASLTCDIDNLSMKKSEECTMRTKQSSSSSSDILTLKSSNVTGNPASDTQISESPSSLILCQLEGKHHKSAGDIERESGTIAKSKENQLEILNQSTPLDSRKMPEKAEMTLPLLLSEIPMPGEPNQMSGKAKPTSPKPPVPSLPCSPPPLPPQPPPPTSLPPLPPSLKEERQSLTPAPPLPSTTVETPLPLSPEIADSQARKTVSQMLSSHSLATASLETLNQDSSEKKKRFSQSPLAIGMLPKIQTQSPLAIGMLPKIVPDPEETGPGSNRSKKSYSSKTDMKAKSVHESGHTRKVDSSRTAKSSAETAASPSPQKNSSRFHFVFKNKQSAVPRSVASAFGDEESDNSEHDAEGEGQTSQAGQDIASAIQALAFSMRENSEPVTDLVAAAQDSDQHCTAQGGNQAGLVTYPNLDPQLAKIIPGFSQGEAAAKEFEPETERSVAVKGKEESGVTDMELNAMGGDASLERDRDPGIINVLEGRERDAQRNVSRFDESYQSREGRERVEFEDPMLKKIKQEKEDDYGDADQYRKQSDEDRYKRRYSKDYEEHGRKKSRHDRDSDRRKRRADSEDSSEDVDRRSRSYGSSRGQDRSREKSRDRDRIRARDRDGRGRDRQRSWDRDRARDRGRDRDRSRERDWSRDRDRNRDYGRDQNRGSKSSRRRSRWSRERTRSRSRSPGYRQNRSRDRYEKSRSRERESERDRSQSMERKSRSEKGSSKKRDSRSFKEEILEELGKLDSSHKSGLDKEYYQAMPPETSDPSAVSAYYGESKQLAYSHPSHTYPHSQHADSNYASIPDASYTPVPTDVTAAGFVPDPNFPVQYPQGYDSHMYGTQWPDQAPHEQYHSQAQYTGVLPESAPPHSYPPAPHQQHTQLVSQFHQQTVAPTPVQPQPPPHFTQSSAVSHPGNQQYPPLPQSIPHVSHIPLPSPSDTEFQHVPTTASRYQTSTAVTPVPPVMAPPSHPQSGVPQGSQFPPASAPFLTPPSFDHSERGSRLPPLHIPFNAPTSAVSSTTTNFVNPNLATIELKSSSSILSSLNSPKTDSKLSKKMSSARDKSKGSPLVARETSRRDSPTTTSVFRNEALSRKEEPSFENSPLAEKTSEASADGNQVTKSRDRGKGGRRDGGRKKSKPWPEDATDAMVSSTGVEDNQGDTGSDSGTDSGNKPLKVKSRWRRNSEAEAVIDTFTSSQTAFPPVPVAKLLLRETTTGSSSPTKANVSEGSDESPVTASTDAMMSVSLPRKKRKVESELSEMADKVEEMAEDGEGKNEDDMDQDEETDSTDLAVLMKRSDFPKFEIIWENIHLTERKKSKSMKRMVCDCTTSREDRSRGVEACGSDCLNRMLMIECGSRCPCGDHCTNRRFQMKQYSKTCPVKTGDKGWGLQALENMEESGTFIMEYVGELLDYEEFVRRTRQYSKAGMQHHYFMALNADEVVDATLKGSISRFINHSCDPNCETQKWTVNGELRVGFFTRKPIKNGEELTFDYQFEHYGEPQKCYCGSEKCRGYIGLVKSPTKSSRKKDKKKKEIFKDELLEKDISKLSLLDGMRNKNHVLDLCRMMVRAEKVHHRVAILKILQETTEPACLRLFLDYHGLPLFWSWMTDVNTTDSDDIEEFKILMLSVLKSLPISNRTMLKESKILNIVEKWALQAALAARASVLPPPPPPTSSATAMTNTMSGNSASSTETTSVPEPEPSSIAQPADNEADSASEQGIPTSSSSSPPTPVLTPPSSNITPISILASAKENKESKRKLRVTFAEEHIESSFSPEPEDDDISSSTQYAEGEGEILEGETSAGADRDKSSSAAKSDERGDGDLADSTSQKENQESGPSSKSSSACDIDASDVADLIQDPITSLASELLSEWSGLKEVFKIPKKERAEERKRTERELDVLSKKEPGTADPYAKWRRRPSRGARKKVVEDEERKANVPKLSKEERRQRFEAKIKAEDELAAQAAAEELQRQQEAYMLHERMMEDPQYYFYHQQQQDPNFAGVDPAVLGHEPIIDPVTGQPIIPGAEQPYFDPHASQAFDPHSGHPLTHPVDPQTGHPIVHPHIDLATGQPVHFDPATGQPLPVDPNTGQPLPLDPATGQPLPLDPDMGQPLPLDPNMGQPLPLDPNMGQPLPLDPNMDQPLPLDPNTGQPLPIDPATGQPLPVDPNTGQPIHSTADSFHHPADPHLGQTHPPAQVIPPSTAQSHHLSVDLLSGHHPHAVDPVSGQPLPQPVLELLPPITPHSQTASAFQANDPVTSGSGPPGFEIEEEVPPPPSPPTAPVTKLPPNWKTAKDAEGRVYYYHAFTRQTQWEMPSWDQNEDDSDNDMELDPVPTEEIVRQQSKRKTTTAAADTSSELAKKIKEQFRRKMSGFIILCLNPYHKPDCKVGRITSTEEFKHLARKLTHHVMSKELKHCRHVEDLEVNENVKAKAKDYVRKYMSKFGATYKKVSSPQLEEAPA